MAYLIILERKVLRYIQFRKGFQIKLDFWGHCNYLVIKIIEERRRCIDF